MNKIFKAVTILMVLLLCLSFTVGAAQSGETKVTTKEELVQDKIKAKDFVKYQQPHDKSKFDRDVAGQLNLKVMSAKNKVPKGFEVPDDGYQTMVSYKTNGKMFIRDTSHKIETIQVPWNEITSLRGWNGESVLIAHYNDYGMQDAVWVQYVYNNNGYAYLEELPFSEIIVSGFVGTYTKEDSNLNFVDTINLGEVFDSDNVNYINLTVEDQYASTTNPYDINTTDLVGWWKFDDDYTDSSGNGNHSTNVGTVFVDGKYNNGSEFNGTSYISLPYNDIGTTLTYVMWLSKDIDTNVNTLSYMATLLRTSSTGIQYWTDANLDPIATSIPFGKDNFNLLVVTSVGNKTYIYNNGLFVEEFDTSPVNNASVSNEIGSYQGSGGFDGVIDDLIIYNRMISEDEIEQLYYLKTSQLKVKTNSNATYSDYWNSSTDNPLAVTYGTGESISSLLFDSTTPIILGGVTVYEPSNMLFNTSVEIGHLENTTNIYEEVNGDSYQIFIQHIPGVNSTSGTISFTSDANAILSSPYLTTGMDTSNTNAVMSYNAATREWTVTTGTITAGTTYNYVLWGVLEGEALSEVVEGGFGSDNMHAYTATANDTIIIGSAFRATYGDTAWGNQSNDLWSNLGPLFILASVILVIGVIFVSFRRFRE